MNENVTDRVVNKIKVVFITSLPILYVLTLLNVFEINTLKNDSTVAIDYLQKVTVILKQTVLSEEGQSIGEITGTGIIFKMTYNHTYVLTNAHVAGNGKKLYTIDVKNKRIYGKLVSQHDTMDLAIVSFPTKLAGKKQIKGIKYPIPGEKVYTMGQHLGRLYIYGEGLYSGIDSDHDVYQLPVAWGCSGSGVFDKNGNLLGLIDSVEGTLIGGRFPQFDLVHGNAIPVFYIIDFVAFLRAF